MACFLVVCIILFLVVMGVIINSLIHTGKPKCKHEWEKIVDHKSATDKSHIVIHMCKKCGTRRHTIIKEE